MCVCVCVCVLNTKKQNMCAVFRDDTEVTTKKEGPV